MLYKRPTVPMLLGLFYSILRKSLGHNDLSHCQSDGSGTTEQQVSLKACDNPRTPSLPSLWPRSKSHSHVLSSRYGQSSPTTWPVDRGDINLIMDLTCMTVVCARRSGAPGFWMRGYLMTPDHFRRDQKAEGCEAPSKL